MDQLRDRPDTTPADESYDLNKSASVADRDNRKNRDALFQLANWTEWQV